MSSSTEHLAGVRYIIDDVAACREFYVRHLGFTVGTPRRRSRT